MQKITRQDRTRLIISVTLLTAVVLLFAYLALSGRLSPMVSQMWELFKDRNQIRTFVESWGNWAPVAFILIQAFQVVFAPIPGELTGAVGGFIFGGVPTVLYSTLGLMIGSVIAFLAARIMGLPLVKLVVSKKSLDRFHFLTERRGALLALVLFIIPGFPKDFLSYMLGLSPMGFPVFVTVCTLGRIPGTIMLSFSGSAVYDENWTFLIVISAICAVALGAVFVWRDKIDSWLRSKREGSAEGTDRVS
ncbi:MAG: TVP38/TMEM64 family protein [Desulfomonilaceae bacterium]|nr:TVP38/TMEM64 family protein [Desulfomonilaceae bacterium]